jgi:hypothetical protein
MTKFQEILTGVSAFVIISCSDLSGLCDHRGPGLARFSYRQEIASAYISNAVEQGGEPVTSLRWEQLKDLTFQTRWNKIYQMHFQYPVFGQTIKKLNGKQLQISGHIIPLNVQAGHYAISKYNFASCFFCGRAGPESVISLKFKQAPKRYKTDKYITISGKMELNDTNVNDFIYIFHDAEEVRK